VLGTLRLGGCLNLGYFFWSRFWVRNGFGYFFWDRFGLRSALRGVLRERLDVQAVPRVRIIPRAGLFALVNPSDLLAVLVALADDPQPPVRQFRYQWPRHLGCQLLDGLARRAGSSPAQSRNNFWIRVFERKEFSMMFQDSRAEPPKESLSSVGASGVLSVIQDELSAASHP